MKRIRILHTADLHLDTSYVSLEVPSTIGNQIRKAQRQTLEQIIAHACNWPADALVIAGDLFDRYPVHPHTVDQVVQLLEQLAPTPVYIAPGNRDPFTNDSPYALELWPSNVFIFPPGQWSSVEHPTVPLTIHGYGHLGTEPHEGWISGLKIPGDDRIHIAAFHGTEKNHKPETGKSFAPFTVNELPWRELAYIALGHFHEMTPIPGDGPIQLWYPGVPQGRNFLERGPRGALQVEITTDTPANRTCSVDQLMTSTIVFEQVSVLAQKLDELNTQVETILSSYNPGMVVLKICIGGNRPPDFMKKSTTLIEKIKNHFLYICLEHRMHISPETWEPMEGNTCLANVIKMIRQRIQDEIDPEVARLEADACELLLLGICEAGIDLPTPIMHFMDTK